MITVEKSLFWTRDLLGAEDDADLPHVTRRFLKAAAFPMIPKDGEEFPVTQYGSGLAWGKREHGPTYEFYSAINFPDFPKSPGEACGTVRWWGYQNQWRLTPLEVYCGDSTLPQNRVFQFVFRKPRWGDGSERTIATIHRDSNVFEKIRQTIKGFRR